MHIFLVVSIDNYFVKFNNNKKLDMASNNNNNTGTNRWRQSNQSNPLRSSRGELR